MYKPSTSPLIHAAIEKCKTAAQEYQKTLSQSNEYRIRYIFPMGVFLESYSPNRQKWYMTKLFRLGEH